MLTDRKFVAMRSRISSLLVFVMVDKKRFGLPITLKSVAGIVVVESAIDALSHAQLHHKETPNDHFAGLKLARSRGIYPRDPGERHAYGVLSAGDSP